LSITLTAVRSQDRHSLSSYIIYYCPLYLPKHWMFVEDKYLQFIFDEI